MVLVGKPPMTDREHVTVQAFSIHNEPIMQAESLSHLYGVWLRQKQQDDCT